ncbi:uncharacterized protein LOC111680273 [Lucilia cuprina]|uniref:uncharacterized protein LOC111680273 n=1 Tax=Lucilia cuprina TaxID=7375 RepID=UPI001F06B0F8|nr:uncharacterized protein LOC111680273 [Lucilia cuprina]
METDDLDHFGEITLEGDSFSDVHLRRPSKTRYRPSPKRLLPPLKPIDFEKYVHENCQNKIKILKRSSIQEITKPMVIFFNHFREKCAYHTKCLDKLFALSLKYGERIEFLAGDMLDIEVMHSKWHSIDFFCSIGSPEKVSSTIYAIDAEKRVYEHESAEKSLESLTNLCEELLKGNLFRSQTLPEGNNCSLVKLCVYDNYKELVSNNMKHVLLVVNLEDYTELDLNYEPNYETIAKQLQPHHIEVVYINAAKNYIPFELGISSYPSLILIPANDKTKFVDPLMGSYTQENIINGIMSYLKDPELFLQQQQLELCKTRYQPLNITEDFKLDFLKLPQYLKDNCQHYLKVFEREAFQRSNRCIIIAFMDFQNDICLAHHLKWIDRIYQVARQLTSPREYFIADFKDIDVINPSWKPQDFIKNLQLCHEATPKVFGIDLNRNKFVLKDFKTAASLFYFAFSLTNGELYISEPWPHKNDGKLVKTCIADSLNLSINSIKKDLLLAIYYSGLDYTEQFLQVLEVIAHEMEKYSVKILKIDSRLNCIPLELDNTLYPIMYFIPQKDKNKHIPFASDNFNKQDIVDFIIKNVKENK